MLKKQLLHALISIFLIFTIGSICFFSIINFIAIKNIEEKNERNYKVLMKDIGTNLDYVVEDIDTLVLNIKELRGLREILMFPKKDEGQKSYQYLLANYELNKIRSYNSFIENQYIYYPHDHKILASSGTFSPKNAYLSLHSSEQRDYEEWLSTIEKKHDKSQIILVGEDILYIESLGNSRNEYYANIIIKLNKQRFENMIQSNMLFDVGEIYLFDKEGKLIYCTKEDLLVEPTLEEKIIKNKDISHTIDEDKVIFQLNKERFHVVVKVPFKTYYKEVSYMKTIYSMFITLTILYMIITIVLIYKKYEIIMNLIKKFSFSGEVIREYDEIAYIKNVVCYMQKQMLDNKQVLLENIFRKALDGIVDYEKELEQEIGTKFEESSYVLVSITADDLEETNNKLIEFIIQNVCQDTLGEEYQFYLMNYDKSYILFVNLDTAIGEYGYEEIVHRLTIMRKFIEDEIGISFIFSLSNIHTKLTELLQAHKEVKEALAYRTFFVEDKMISFERTIKEDFVLYDAKQEMEFIRYIKNEEIEQAISFLDRLFKNNFEKRTPSLEKTRDFIEQLKKNIASVCKEIGVEEPCYGQVDFLNMKIGEIKEYFKSCIVEIGKELSHLKEVEINEKIENIVRYVEANYCNSDLTVGSIAEIFDMKVSYLSRFFKENREENLLQYINKLRVQKAKELLINTNFNLNEIAESVGLLNNVALIRCFKKYEVITPNEYRNMHKNDNV